MSGDILMSKKQQKYLVTFFGENNSKLPLNSSVKNIYNKILSIQERQRT